MPRSRRTRHEVSPALISVLSPALRYSSTREAYVLKGVGNRRGPVLRKRNGSGRSAHA